MLRIRPYEPGESAVLMTLFREPVRAVATRDYGPEEVAAWAPAELDAVSWSERLARNLSLVAVEGERVVGFAELTDAGHIDMLYVAKDRQRQGVARALMERMEREARKHGLTCLTTDASRTHRPFFEACCFNPLRAQFVIRAGLRIENFRMRKIP